MNSKQPIILRLSYCTIERVIEEYDGRVKAEDIKHLINDGEIHPSVLMNGQYAVVMKDGDQGANLDISTADIITLDVGFNGAYLQKIESHDDIPENYKKIERTGIGVIAQAYGLWKVDCLISNYMAFLKATSDEYNIKCLTNQYDELPIFLDQSEIKKLHRIITNEEVIPTQPTENTVSANLTEEQKKSILALSSPPMRTKNTESLTLALGLMCELLKQTSHLYSKGETPNYSQIQLALEKQAASLGVSFDGLSNLNRDLSKAHKLVLSKR